MIAKVGMSFEIKVETKKKFLIRARFIMTKVKNFVAKSYVFGTY